MESLQGLNQVNKRNELRISLFGGLFIDIDGEPVTGFSTQKEAILLAYLALEKRPFTREYLANLLWEDRSQSQVQSNLRTLLTRFRKLVGDYMIITRKTVAVDLENVSVDVNEFETLLAQVEKGNLSVADIEIMETAVSLYHGNFLAGVHIAENEALENWQLFTAERLNSQVIKAQYQLAQFYFHHRQPAQGIPHAQALVQLDPLNEDGQRLLMRLLARDGQINAALQQYPIYTGQLAQQLGVEPAQETQALYSRLQTAQASPPIQLPFPDTSFVGRADELHQIEQLLEEENGRLLTIVGMGGSGKTRLALQAANERKHSYLHGIYFVSLASLTTAATLPTQIAEAIGLSLDNHNISKQLLQYLKNKELLLLLDNIEHLLGAPETISFIQQMRQQAPYLTLMVTSRQPLRLQSEWIVRLDGLPYPPVESQLNVPETYAAVNLFGQRALQQGFTIKPQMEADVNQICRLVEGLPLAIELVTATMDVYALTEIIQFIHHQMDKLAASFHDLPTRHRSIHAVFDYSWQLLSVEEQQVLGRLSLFQGKFTQTAVIQITKARRGILQNLVNKSLLRQDADGRFSLHTLIRQFVTEKWGVETAVVQQHSTYYLTLLAQQEPHIYRKSMPQALQAIRDDFENMRLAWQNGVQDQQYDLLQNCLSVISTLPHFLNLLPDWVQLLTQARKKAKDAPREIQLNLAVTHAAILIQLSQIEKAHEILQTISSQLLAEGDASAHASVIYLEAESAHIQGDYPKAISLVQEAITISQTHQFTGLEAFCYKLLGADYIKLGKTEEATAVLNKATRLFAQIGKPYCEAQAYHILGVQAYNHGQYEESLSKLQESLTRKKALAGSFSIVMTLNHMGLVANDMGDYDAAEKYYGEASQIQHNMANNQEKAMVLHNLGLLAQHRRQFEKAEQYYQRALSINPGAHQTGITIGNLGDTAFFSGNYALAKKRYAEGLLKREALQDIRGIIWSSCCNAVAANILGDYEKGQQFSERAIQLAEELHEQPRLAFALTYWGDARRGLGHREEAKEAYQRVLAIRQTLNVAHLTAVPATRLGQLALEDEEVETANHYVEQLLPYLQKSPLGNIFISGEAPLLCYQVLSIQGDKRADSILQSAYTTLLTTAEQYTSEAMQTMFLQNVLAHRRLKMLFEMSETKGTNS